MKNDNDLILERLRGVPAHKPSWRDKFEAGNPNTTETNDNEPADPRRDCPWKCHLGDPKCVCAQPRDPGQSTRDT